QADDAKVHLRLRPRRNAEPQHHAGSPRPQQGLAPVQQKPVHVTVLSSAALSSILNERLKPRRQDDVQLSGEKSAGLRVESVEAHSYSWLRHSRSMKTLNGHRRSR